VIPAFSQNAHKYRIWATNVMARGQDHTKGPPDVDEKRTTSHFYGDFLQAHTPRLEFEAYEAAANYQDGF